MRLGDICTVADVGNLDGRQYTASEVSKYGAAWTFTCRCGQKDAAAATTCGHGPTTGRGDAGSSAVHAPPAAGATHRCRGRPAHIDGGTHPCSDALTTPEEVLQ